MAAFAGLICPEITPRHTEAFARMARALGEITGTPASVAQVRHAGILATWAGQTGSLAVGATQDHRLVFRGELFGDDLRVRHGPVCDDTRLSPLLARWEDTGAPCLESLNGWFSLLAIHGDRVVLAIDRFGLGRTFIHEDDGALWFSTEARALFAAVPTARSFDHRSLGEFLSCGCVLQNRTLFHGVTLLPRASVWTFVRGRSESRSTYFDPASWESLPALSVNEYAEKLRTTWLSILPRYLDGSDSALSMTGGIDSRMILAAARERGGIGTCYTFGGTYRDCADVRLARRLAGLCGLPHAVIPIDAGFLRAFPETAPRAVVLADGHLDVSGSIDLFVQSGAGALAPTRVTGTNGGEILRRLVAFRPGGSPRDAVTPEISTRIEEAAQTYQDERKGHPLSFTAFKQTPWHMNNKFMLERRMVRLCMPYLDNDLVALAYQVPTHWAESMEPVFDLVRHLDPRMARIPTDRNLIHPPTPVITPLRHAFSQFTFKAEYAFDTGMPQWLARATRPLTPFHPERLILGRHKFHHFRIWYRGPLAPYVKEILLDPITLGRAYVDRSRLESIVAAHTSGRGNYTEEIHKSLTLELIERHLFSP